MDTKSLFHVENRRPGLWIVAARASADAPAQLFTIEIGQDRTTFEYGYRVSGAGRADFRHIHHAMDFCKTSIRC